MLRSWVALGIPEVHICAIVRDHRKKELELGAAELNSHIGAFMVATILGRDPRARVKE